MNLIIKHFGNTLCKLHIELYTLCLLLRNNGMFASRLEQNTLAWGNTLGPVQWLTARTAQHNRTLGKVRAGRLSVTSGPWQITTHTGVTSDPQNVVTHLVIQNKMSIIGFQPFIIHTMAITNINCANTPITSPKKVVSQWFAAPPRLCWHTH